jgi:hypothetical protein
MRIQFQRSGGFTGMRVEATIDTASLDPAKAEKVHMLVNSAGFFDLPERLHTSLKGVDELQYVITAEEEGRRHTVYTSDGAAPASLRPLLRELTLLARSR